MKNEPTLTLFENPISFSSSSEGRTFSEFEKIKPLRFKIFILFLILFTFSSLSQASHCTKAHATEQTQTQYMEILEQQAKNCITNSKNTNTKSCCSSIENLKICCSRETDSSPINCHPKDIN